MKRALLVIMFGTLYVLHQDFWFWRTANPLAFGFIPVGLLYHACYTLATAFALWLLVKYAWPSELEEGGGDEEGGGGGGGWGEGAGGRGGAGAFPPPPPTPLPPCLRVSPCLPQRR